MKALIMAGGYATRLWPLTKGKAKPLLLINGKPLISHIVEKIPSESEIIVATNDTFKKDFQKWSQSIGRDIEFVFEKTKSDKDKLGVLGAIAEIIKNKKIKEDLLILGGDNYFHFSIESFLKEYKGNPLLGAFDIKDKESARKFGVLVLDRKRVIDFEEKPENPKSTLVNTFCFLLPKKYFPLLLDFVKTYRDNQGAFVTHLLEKNVPVDAYVTRDSWYDIGSFEGYLEAHQNIEGSRKVGDYNFYGVEFDGKNTIEGKVFIDKGTTIKNSRLKNCIILNDCLIKNSIVENSIIDEKSRITGCRIGDDVIEKGSVLNCRNDKCVRKRIYIG